MKLRLVTVGRNIGEPQAKDAVYSGLKGEIPPVVYMTYDQGYPEPEEMVFELRTARAIRCIM